MEMMPEEWEEDYDMKYRRRYSSWLQWTGNFDCVASKAAFIAEEIRPMDSRCTARNHELKFKKILSRCALHPDCLRSLRSWRHAQLRLDLLQFALVHSDDCTFILLAMEKFDLHAYQGNSASGGQLVNHPIHLACVFQSHSFVRFTTLSELPWEEEGIIKVGDIWTISTQSPSWNLLGNNTTLRGTTLEFAAKYSPKCLSELLALALRTVEAEARAGGTSASSVSRLWDVISAMADNGRTDDTCQMILRLLHGQLSFERSAQQGRLLLLFCQLLCASDWKLGETSYLDRLPFSTAMLEADISLIAQFLTQGQLFSFIEILQRRIAAKCFIQRILFESYVLYNESVPCSWMLRLVTLLELEQSKRTLHQECVLALIRSVRGDVRRLQRVNMPDSLRQYFRVPFSTQEAEPSDDAP